MPETMNQAELASQQALEAVYSCLDEGQSFRLEAGAGAGKTYSLVKALQHLIRQHYRSMPRRGEKIACITFTNVAKDEILARIDRSPLILCDTNHSFCWSLISSFQRQLRDLIAVMPEWQERIEAVNGLGERVVEYSLGHREIREHSISLHHNDILPLTIKLMENEKFRRLMSAQYPIILIDEYQDTDADWVEAIKIHFLGQPRSPLFGFFGDHWQKIYGNGCGKLEHNAVKEIGKKANFRSAPAVVNVLNQMRPELPQAVVDQAATGEVQVFHSNAWNGQRQSGSHWAGDLPSDIAHQALEKVKETLTSGGWNLSAEATKFLMLTHRILANEQGYPTLPTVFQYNDAFAAKEHSYISFFVDVLEPACDAYVSKNYGAMFEALDTKKPLIRKPEDKTAWTVAMDVLLTLREQGTVGEIINHLLKVKRPRLPDKIVSKELELQSFDRTNDDSLPNSLAEIEKLHAVDYSEIKALRAYHSGFSPFETKHGVKGAEFENVIVIIGRGWNKYNFEKMLELALTPKIPPKQLESFERNRNLFYVSCSRPKSRLALLFTQELSSTALATLTQWFGSANITALAF